MKSWLTARLGRLRVSTIVLIVVFLALFWVYHNFEPRPAAPPTAVVPPGFVPDPNYTWVPRTDVRRPRETLTTTETTTTTTTTSPQVTTTTTSPGETTSPTSPTESTPTTTSPGETTSPTPTLTPTTPPAAGSGPAPTTPAPPR